MMSLSQAPFLRNTIDQNTFVIFLHIQKTAGITVQTHLRQHFRPGLLRRASWRLRKDPRLAADIRRAAEARTKRDGYFGGHFCFGIHQHLPKPASYMTFLRDPVKRVVSLYIYSRDNPDAFYHKHAKGRSLLEFVRDSGLQELDNGMVRFIAGDSDSLFINRTPYGEVDEDLLEIAKSNLERYFFFVGLQERFDESFLLLSRDLVIMRPRYLRLNTARPSSKSTPPDAEVIAEIRKRSQMDQRLYDHVAEHFEQRIQAAFPDREAVMVEFAKQNHAYNARMKPLHNFLIRFRPRGFSAG